MESRLDLVEKQTTRPVHHGLVGGLIKSLSSRKEPAPKDGDDEDESGYEGVVMQGADSVTSTMTTFNNVDRDDDTELPFGVLHPSGNLRVTLDLFGAFFIAFD